MLRIGQNPRELVHSQINLDQLFELESGCPHPPGQTRCRASHRPMYRKRRPLLPSPMQEPPPTLTRRTPRPANSARRTAGAMMTTLNGFCAAARTIVATASFPSTPGIQIAIRLHRIRPAVKTRTIEIPVLSNAYQAAWPANWRRRLKRNSSRTFSVVESQHLSGDKGQTILKGKMARLQAMNLGARQILEKCFTAFGREKYIALAPEY
jgi:hypothetical protein